jgi:hypothetical protein
VDTLRTMDRQTADGAAWLTARAVSTRTDAPLQDLGGWAAQQSAGLSALTPEVPAGALDQMNSSLTLLAQVGDRGAALLTALDCPRGPATAGTDVLGPRPAPCTAQPVPGTAPDSGGVLSGSGAAPSSGGAAPSTTAVPGGPAPDQGGGAVPTAGPTGSGGAAPGAGSSATAGRPAPPSVAVPTVPGVPTTLPVPSLPVQVPLPLPLPGAGSGGGAGGATSSSPPLIDTHLPICIKPLIC